MVFASGYLQPTMREETRGLALWVGATDQRDNRAIDSGVVPDVVVATTLVDRSAGRDLVLEKALALAANSA